MMQPFEIGTKLAVQLQRRHAGVSNILTAQVCHVRQLAETFWFIGCRLSRNLSAAERRGLLLGDLEKTFPWAFGGDG
jgi:hypothetical protein